MKKIILAILFVTLTFSVSALPQFIKVKQTMQNDGHGWTSPIDADFEISIDGGNLTVEITDNRTSFQVTNKPSKSYFKNGFKFKKYYTVDNNGVSGELEFKFNKNNQLISIRVIYSNVEFIFIF